MAGRCELEGWGFRLSTKPMGGEGGEVCGGRKGRESGVGEGKGARGGGEVWGEWCEEKSVGWNRRGGRGEG